MAQIGVDTIIVRDKGFVVRLTKEELRRLDRNVERTGLTREGYVRDLIRGYEPQTQPPIEYYHVLRELRSIKDVMHKLAMQSRTFSAEDAAEYNANARRLGLICDDLQSAFLPRKRE